MKMTYFNNNNNNSPRLLKSEQPLFQAWLKTNKNFHDKDNPTEEKLHLP